MDKRLIKMYYKLGIYNDDELDSFVKSGDITEAEKQEIMEGKQYG